MDKHLDRTFKILSPRYEQTVCIDSMNQIQFRRRHLCAKKFQDFDIFGSSWLVSVAYFPEGLIHCHRFSKRIYFKGWNLLYRPPFSLVHWSFNPGCIEWIGFMGENEIDHSLPKAATLFPITENGLPQDHHQALMYVRKGTQAFHTIIEKQETESKVAKRTKEYIDQNFTERCSIDEIAKNLDTNRVYLGREFKKCFGLTPIDYRNRIRVFHSTKLLRQGMDVTQAAYQAGFGHISRFQFNFKTIMNVNPLEFCLSKKVKGPRV